MDAISFVFITLIITMSFSIWDALAALIMERGGSTRKSSNAWRNAWLWMLATTIILYISNGILLTLSSKGGAP